VPYRSQLDGNPYAESDCGPASMAMALGYHGRNVPTRDLRALVNDLQGTHGMYDAGSTIESLAAIAQRHGLRALDLQNGSKLRRWTIDDVRRHLEAGNPIVPQVWYRGLPGRESRSYQGDHYVVLVGYDGDEVLYHDPIDKDGPGAFRRMTPAQLDKAWRNSDFPYAALAVGRP
jgi:ABC-type bacteriocin/lantibiotic exporter with double-glycine peptidase domain